MKMNNLEEKITALEGQTQELLKQVCILYYPKLKWRNQEYGELEISPEFESNAIDALDFYNRYESSCDMPQVK